MKNSEKSHLLKKVHLKVNDPFIVVSKLRSYKKPKVVPQKFSSQALARIKDKTKDILVFYDKNDEIKAGVFICGSPNSSLVIDENNYCPNPLVFRVEEILPYKNIEEFLANEDYKRLYPWAENKNEAVSHFNKLIPEDANKVKFYRILYK